MFKISLSDGLAAFGIISMFVLVALDKAEKLKGPLPLLLLAVAALMTLPLALGNSWVSEAPSVTHRVFRSMMMLSIVGLSYSALVNWILPEKPLNTDAVSGETITANFGHALPVQPPVPSAINLSAECHNAVLPTIIPSSGSVYAGELFVGVNNQAGQLNQRYGEPGTKFKWFKNRNPGGVYRCEIRNYGDNPIFNVEIGFKVEFNEVIKVTGVPSITQKSGKAIGSGVWVITAPRIDPGKDNPFIFYIFNITEYYANAWLQNTASYILGANDTTKYQAKMLLPDFPILNFSEFRGER